MLGTDPTQLETLCRGLFVSGHRASAARSASQATSLLAEQPFDLPLTVPSAAAPFAPEELDAAVRAAAAAVK